MDDGAAIRRLLDRRELASRRIQDALGRRLRLSDPQLRALALLESAGELTPSRLGALLDLSSGGVTALLQRLERDGFVTRSPHPTDRRSCLIRPASETLRDRIEAIAPADEVDATLASLDASQRAVVVGFLERVTAATEAHAARLWPEREDEDDDASLPAVPSLWS